MGVIVDEEFYAVGGGFGDDAIEFGVVVDGNVAFFQHQTHLIEEEAAPYSVVPVAMHFRASPRDIFGNLALLVEEYETCCDIAAIFNAFKDSEPVEDAETVGCEDYARGVHARYF